MLLQNQISELPNHYTVIKEQFERATEVRLVVAYIKKRGVEMLRQWLNGPKSIKLLCSFDMNITDPDAIAELLGMGVEIKIYHTNEGTFHPKVWLFKESGHQTWNCIIGSANLTKAALSDNVEASVFINRQNNINGLIEQSLLFFSYLWNSANAKGLNPDSLAEWQTKLSKRKKINARINSASKAQPLPYDTIELLFNFAQSWIGIDKNERDDEVIGSLWRGWYIIPDQGYIDDKLMMTMQKITKCMNRNGGYVVLDDNDKVFLEILQIVKSPDRKKFKMSQRDLFVRQQKNYLMKLGFARHNIKLGKNTLDKSVLYLTALGQDLAQCKNIDEIKAIYTDFLEDYHYNGLKIVAFTRNLLLKHAYITFKEFSYFVCHAYTESELSEISQLISLYRGLDETAQAKLDEKINTYFQAIKEPTAQAVRSNYDKKVRHTMSAIGWCQDLSIDSNNWILSNKNP